MNCIVFIGTYKSGSSYDAITAAKEMDYFTVLLTAQDSHIKNKEHFSNVDVMIPCNTHDVVKIKYEIDGLRNRGANISAIVSFIEEHCYIASFLAKEYGLVHSSIEAIRIMLDKLETRKAICGTLYSPDFYEIKNKDDFDKEIINKYLPFILKEPLSTGSKWVAKIDSLADFENEIQMFEKECCSETLLIESYLNGPQFLVETLVIDDKPHIIAIIEQEVSYVNRFIITGYKVIHDHQNELMRSLITAVGDIVMLIGIKNGPCHLELVYDREQWKLIEINPRISGGAMNLLIKEATGINLAKETLKISLGQKPDLTEKYKKEVFVQYVISNKEGRLLKVTGRNKARNCEGVRHVFIKPKRGQLIFPPRSMGHRYAYVIAIGSTANEAMFNAKRAADHIQFYVKEMSAVDYINF